jgi:translation initiation factor 2B subunit (eIF-2B alpha/beta/delta family)
MTDDSGGKVVGRIGLTPVPDDEELLRFLKKTISHDTDHLEEVMADLMGSVEETLSKEQPEEFVYAKLMNFLASLERPVRIHLCAAALWKLHGQENATLHVLPPKE